MLGQGRSHNNSCLSLAREHKISTAQHENLRIYHYILTAVQNFTVYNTSQIILWRSKQMTIKYGEAAPSVDCNKTSKYKSFTVIPGEITLNILIRPSAICGEVLQPPFKTVLWNGNSSPYSMRAMFDAAFSKDLENYSGCKSLDPVSHVCQSDRFLLILLQCLVGAGQIGYAVV